MKKIVKTRKGDIRKRRKGVRSRPLTQADLISLNTRRDLGFSEYLVEPTIRRDGQIVDPGHSRRKRIQQTRKSAGTRRGHNNRPQERKTKKKNRSCLGMMMLGILFLIMIGVLLSRIAVFL